MQYDHKRIEKKWQAFWAKHKVYTAPDTAPGKENFYLLVEFPYPSGNLHVGHWYAFALPDILARYQRMRGKNVLYPIGFDAFGLPAENAAIKNGLDPRKWTEKNIAYMTKQIESMGTSFDWSRKVSTIDPEYYKWTQWLFLQLHKKGLVYQKETAVNWCPKDKTVLANEQVVGGKCERCDSEVVQKLMLQWNIKITDYADRLVDDLAALDWPEQIKESQRNWIGRSEGAEIDFHLDIPTGIERFIILHAKGASPESDFYRWLEKELVERGYKVEIPTLPNAKEPDDVEQAEYVKKHCVLNERTAVVGHSAGGLAALRLLETQTVGRLVLVGAPYSPVFIDGKKRPSVARSLKRGYDYDAIRAHARSIIALYDEGDPIIPLSDGEAFAKHLGATFVKGRGNAGHFNSQREQDVLMACIPTVRVFTTRPDTIFGATYLVLAPEHPWVKLALQHKTVLKNTTIVQAYVDAAARKTELERQTDQKDKTGVKLEGVGAINPATGEHIPLYVADYALGHYGTGAIMAVPAHDERDLEFAKKFDLPVRQVVEPLFIGKVGESAVKEGQPFVKREAVCAIVRNPKDDTYLCISWKGAHMHGLVTGGIDEGEDIVEAARREILEETGYKDLRHIERPLITINTQFYHRVKKENRWAHFHYVFFDLESDQREAVDEKEGALHEVVWIKKKDLANFFTVFEGDYVVRLLEGGEAYSGDGILTDSGPFTGKTASEARDEMGRSFGRLRKTYKLRDWIVSRQRYWGVPIPMIHCSTCGIVPVPDKDLPVKLPEVKDYLPEGSGKSPLAKATRWVRVKCPACKAFAERETDTLDTFVDSSWYFLRYTDPKNKKKFADPKRLSKWMPVDLYSGGAEHTTMHVLYSRFWHKALYDLGLVKEPEPYARRMNRSLIMGPDGQKMSKSRGNVIDPDEVVARLGADTVRMYLAFIGPYGEVSNYPWNPDGVVGVRRFIERAWRLAEAVVRTDVVALEAVLHRTIKKVGEDIEAQKYNTAISQMMIFLNDAEKAGAIGQKQWQRFLTLLAPFAPHIAEELWSRSKKTSIHKEKWPTFEEKYLVDESISIAVQINGKTRGGARVSSDADKAAMEAAARGAVAPRLEGKEILRTVVVPGRLVNFVVKE